MWRCLGCGHESDRVASARVRSNVRRFVHETFALWQCPGCASIHAADELELAPYYASYPYHAQSSSLPVRLALDGKLRQLRALGLRKSSRVLDYGCGGGLFLDHLRLRGYANVSGYDAFVHEGPYASEPSGRFDVVLSQDVIEHVDDPRAHLQTLIALTEPGGLVFIGTPDAAAVDMTRAEQFLQILHQPYHRHVLSAHALRSLVTSRGGQIVRVKHGYVGNRAIPGLNGAYLQRVLRAHGDVLDEMATGAFPFTRSMFTPAALWDMFTGYWHDPGHDLTLAFRTR